MSVLEMIAICLGLTIDSFAISLCIGIKSKENFAKTGIICGFWFTLFQLIMAAIGFLIGEAFNKTIAAFDHWLAFIIFSILGIKLLLDSASTPIQKAYDSKFSQIIPLSLSSSLDSLAGGITVSILETNATIFLIILALCTLILSFVGSVIGKFFGSRFEKLANLLGGIIIILLGIKILIEYLI